MFAYQDLDSFFTVLWKALAVAVLLSVSMLAQNSTGVLRGQVTDPSGAVIRGAHVTAVAGGAAPKTTVTDANGSYQINNLPAGKYQVTTTAAGFAVDTEEQVEVTPGKPLQFNIALQIQVESEKVEVQEDNSGVDVAPSNNAGAIVISGKELDALSDDPDELQQDLEALAGPSAGPDGGQIYIDGFTAGQLPPKSSIREIRINQNPFSSEYDKLGYGRIEVFTKPGTDKLHGQFSVIGNTAAFNSQNPFITNEPPYYSTIYMGNVGGPISKKASYFVDFQRRNINELAIVDTPALDANQNQITLSETVPNPRTRTNVGTRFDYQISKNNTLTARYQFFSDTQNNAGVGGFALPSNGYNADSTEHTVQISDSQVIGAKIVNETRFQYLRDNSAQTPVSTLPTLNVIGAFTGGGNNQGLQNDHTDRYELQNYTSMAEGNHLIKFGARLRVAHQESTSGAGFNGSFTFASLSAYSLG
ncbi:MAG: carboxypeptidase regulatory-like domain-containing protein, partial [Acidobacteriales bacterium]|nr:carboxypeptidase regulatory-like domain-containing protein [Terriglobales bacterium]